MIVGLVLVAFAIVLEVMTNFYMSSSGTSSENLIKGLRTIFGVIVFISTGVYIASGFKKKSSANIFEVF